MNDRIKEAFDQIHADEGLKDRTKAYIAERTAQYGEREERQTRRMRSGVGGTLRGGSVGRLSGRAVMRIAVSAATCVLCFLLGFGGYHVYFTATSVISIDINPSIELGINRFDRVITVEGYNDDGRRLAESLDVRFMKYSRALEKILENESVTDYLAKDELLSVVVVESDEEKSRTMLSNVETCVSGHGNARCHSTETGAVAGAHAAGLSYGKYLAFLELRELAPDITVQDVQGMTMREIRDMIVRLLPDGADGGWLDAIPEGGHHGGEAASEVEHHGDEALDGGRHEEEDEYREDTDGDWADVMPDGGHHEEEDVYQDDADAGYDGGGVSRDEDEHESSGHGHGHGHGKE